MDPSIYYISLVVVALDETERLLAQEKLHSAYPMLQIHGKDDRLADFKAAESVYDIIEAPQKVFKSYEDGCHVRTIYLLIAEID